MGDDDGVIAGLRCRQRHAFGVGNMSRFTLHLRKAAVGISAIAGVWCHAVPAHSQPDSCLDFIMAHRFGNDAGYRDLADTYFRNMDKAEVARGGQPTGLTSRSVIMPNLGASQ